MTWETQLPGSSTWNQQPGEKIGWPKIDPDVDQTLWDLQQGVLTVWDGNQGGTSWDLGPSINDEWHKVAS